MVKGKFYKIIVWPAMMYGFECWTLNKKEKNESAEMVIWNFNSPNT